MDTRSALRARPADPVKPAPGAGLGPDRAEECRLKSLEVKVAHEANKAAGFCITSKRHPQPRINPRTGKRYTRCDACRAVHARSA